MLNGKTTIILLRVGLIKTTYYKWVKFFILLIFPFYASKADLQNATGVDTLKLAKIVDLASSKSKIDKLDIGRLETTSADLKKLSDSVDKEFVKNCVWWTR